MKRKGINWKIGQKERPEWKTVWKKKDEKESEKYMGYIHIYWKAPEGDESKTGRKNVLSNIYWGSPQTDRRHEFWQPQAD